MWRLGGQGSVKIASRVSERCSDIGGSGKNMDRTSSLVCSGFLSCIQREYKLRLCCLYALLFPSLPQDLLNCVWKMSSSYRYSYHERQGLVSNPPDLKLPLDYKQQANPRVRGQ